MIKLEKDEILFDFYLKGNIFYCFVGFFIFVVLVCIEECFVCGECIEVCFIYVIVLSDEGKIEIEIIKCIKCCVCVKECFNGVWVFDIFYIFMLY